MKLSKETVPVTINETPFRAPLNANLLQFILSKDLAIETACAGMATCHLCRVTVTDGLSMLAPHSRKEERALGNLVIAAGVRLSCQISITHPLTITIPPPRPSSKRRNSTKTGNRR